MESIETAHDSTKFIKLDVKLKFAKAFNSSIHFLAMNGEGI